MQDNQPQLTLGDLLRGCSWFQIFKASRQALQAGKILLAAAGLLVTLILGYALDRVWVGCGWGINPSARIPLKVDFSVEQVGIFEAVLQHEKYCLDQGLKAARKLNLAGRAGEIWWHLHQRGAADVNFDVGEGYGVLAYAIAMGQGLFWALRHHLIFGIIMLLLLLANWALFGGAICRMSALRFARDERIPAGEALAYSRSKFGEFFSAPLIPVGIVVFIGLVLALAGWIMSWPYIGPLVSLLGGPLFGLVLVAGGVMALCMVGAIGGFSLMWPTLAVEGLDSTDAISRSFSYFLERMERALVYAAVALVYGALVWLVVRMFAFLLVYGAHGFFSKGYPSLDHIWATPTFDALYAVSDSADDVDSWSERYVGLLVRTWVGLAGFVLYGYLLSYYFSASTIIYFLLRRKVDDMELDDVYTESAEDMVLSAPLDEPADAEPTPESSDEDRQDKPQSGEETDGNQ